VITVQRWEKKEGMPVHRHLHDKRGSVYALPEELDAWRSRRQPSGEPEIQPRTETPVARITEPATRAPRGWLWTAIGVVALLVLIAAYFVFHHRQANQSQARIHSLAVLPLRSLSADSSPDYLADGVTEALIGRLASIGDLRVISHTSVMRFKNPQISVPEIAKKLDVDAIVEGSVMREGSNEAPGSWSANRNPLKPNCRA